MKNLFDTETYQETNTRINNLSADSKGQWGKMSVGQMLAHLQIGFKILLKGKPVRRLLLGRLIGWMVKKIMYNDAPWKNSLPTSPIFIIKDERKFEEEKKQLLDLIEKFYQAGSFGIGDKIHPFFGKFTAEQWGKTMWKHIDHHLRQFGV
ncbi:MAG: DUF1569 domain-containing protein [Chitinophagaceae bacterium]|nr:MAG: DUF1569 domain-containing protein [Chitinophagaceae bacterium]